jgi:amidase
MVNIPWELQAEKLRRICTQSMNPAWLLPEEQLPPSDQLNVIDFMGSCKALSTGELEITKMIAVDLVSNMASRSLTAVETDTAVLQRAHVGQQQQLNFAPEFLIDEALTRAAELDLERKETGKIVGPLHGVAISIKEYIGLSGHICNASSSLGPKILLRRTH